MSENGWTPGPWSALEQMSKEHESLGWIINHANGRIGWSSFATATPNKGEGPPFTQSAANAHLIAASPALAEALEDVRDNLVVWLDAEWGLPGHEQLIDRVLAALNLAKGRTV